MAGALTGRKVRRLHAGLSGWRMFSRCPCDKEGTPHSQGDLIRYFCLNRGVTLVLWAYLRSTMQLGYRVRFCLAAAIAELRQASFKRCADCQV